MKKETIIRVLNAVYAVLQLFNIFYLITFINDLQQHSATVFGKTVLYLDSQTLDNFFSVELAVMLASLFVVAGIVDLALRRKEQ